MTWQKMGQGTFEEANATLWNQAESSFLSRAANSIWATVNLFRSENTTPP